MRSLVSSTPVWPGFDSGPVSYPLISGLSSSVGSRLAPRVFLRVLQFSFLLASSKHWITCDQAFFFEREGGYDRMLSAGWMDGFKHDKK